MVTKNLQVVDSAMVTQNIEQLAGRQKKKKIFSFAVQTKTGMDKQFVLFTRDTVKRTDDSYQPAQHSSSVMYNISNHRGACNITTTCTVIHPVSFICSLDCTRGRGSVSFCIPVKSQSVFGLSLGPN